MTLQVRTLLAPRHLCHADGCTRAVAERFLMCRPHWRMVPRRLQAAVWDAYRLGQELDKRPSDEWLRAADAAIAAVRDLEARHRPPALFGPDIA